MRNLKVQLQLRPLVLSDLTFVHELHSLQATDEFNTLGIPENITATKSVLNKWMDAIEQGQRYVFCIEISGTFAGLIGMTLGKSNYSKAEIWYKVHPEFWGNGIATEAVKRILGFGFEKLKLYRIEAGCSTEHAASIKVLEKNGFLKEGCSRKNLPIRGVWKDNYNFGILDEEWNKNGSY